MMTILIHCPVFNEDFDLESLVAHCMIGDGDGAECLSSANVTIVNDMALEGEHSFTVTLNASEASAMGYTLGSRNVLTVIISDTADCKKKRFLTMCIHIIV